MKSCFWSNFGVFRFFGIFGFFEKFFLKYFFFFLFFFFYFISFPLYYRDFDFFLISYTVIPFYLMETWDDKNWQLSQGIVMAILFSGNNVSDLTSASLNLRLPSSVKIQHAIQLIFGKGYIVFFLLFFFFFWKNQEKKIMAIGRHFDIKKYDNLGSKNQFFFKNVNWERFLPCDENFGKKYQFGEIFGPSARKKLYQMLITMHYSSLLIVRKTILSKKTKCQLRRIFILWEKCSKKRKLGEIFILPKT